MNRTAIHHTPNRSGQQAAYPAGIATNLRHWQDRRAQPPVEGLGVEIYSLLLITTPPLLH